MLQIMLTCARTGKVVPTGIETDIDTFVSLPNVISSSHCPACGGMHYWTKRETWVCSRGTPAILSADMIIPH
jgi:hypothetical protein